MDEIMTVALKLVIMIAIAIISTYIVPWLEANIDNKQANIVVNWVKIFVSAAEQIWPNNGQKTGQTKLEQVTEWINNLTSELGVTYTEEQIRGLIEDAVKSLNDSKETSDSKEVN